MLVDKFIPKPYTQKVEAAKVQHRAPSNIALVKYWGKKDEQIPMNPSISFTLSNSYTETIMEIAPRTDFTTSFQIDFYFEEEPKENFLPKIETFFTRIRNYIPFLRDYYFIVRTRNSFPHSSGIASSASGMAALAVCLMKIEKLFYPEMSEKFFYEKASFLARLGSGSACRSTYGGVVIWGAHSAVPDSSNFYGVPMKDIHEVFNTFQDSILLIDKGQKPVSSSKGHKLMHDHPYAEARFAQARQNITLLRDILAQGNLDEFCKLVESEALALHAMMLTSNPYYILMRPNTLSAIERIWYFRASTATPVCFTLDAGANIHLLYPEAYKKQVHTFIESQLKPLCQDGDILYDQVGI
ncbi:MAG: diphosphomevalonate decarboxylase [Capnocytophaga sp.]|jgi:diphosphomevalonate decarboxylase|uniref:diphosphomevalonate/mevalonate 3,5-bisphosphate decarboxylase family protein n=1 Tax=Capnocytophaga sp. oral taxon 863 TaxID=1227265 RepID=UPI000396D672|nr:diphosphomevalonate decarboxylase [Capnocytophaga sp. oral taxon 863]ERI62836.1 diphosphomevalonate decarboxylase [Capnocytophaga sp. oral taxon 863 str. F0517]RKW06970.1 MAG: diphosphomevalonate decarboxylase [Capnocytophaga sp.]